MLTFFTRFAPHFSFRKKIVPKRNDLENIDWRTINYIYLIFLNLTMRPRPIVLEAVVSDPPIFDGSFHIPIVVNSFRIIEKTDVIQNLEENRVDYGNNILRTPGVEYGGAYISTVLPIFNGDYLRIYISDLGIGNIQEREAEKIELLDSDKRVRAVYEKRRDR